MHILLVNDDLPPEILGGSGRVVVETARAFAERGHTVTLLAASHRTDWRDVIPGVDIRVIPRLPQRWAHWRSVFSRTRAKEVARHVREIDPDVIHCHALAWQMGYRWLSLIPKDIPCFYTAHGMMTIAYGKVTGREHSLWWKDLRRARWTMNPLRGPMIRRFFRRFTRVLTVSDALRAHLAHYGHTNMETLHNGIDTDFWKPAMSQTDARTHCGITTDLPIFFLAGRLGYDKGLNLLLDLWPRFSGKAVLLLAGDVPIPVPRTDDFIVLPPQTPDVMRDLYLASDVTLVPSLCFDCFPTTSLESMACGRPVIVGDRGGGKEAIINGTTGWVVDPGNAEQVARRIAWCIRHREELSAMGEHARIHVVRSFMQEAHVDHLLAMYQRFLTK